MEFIETECEIPIGILLASAEKGSCTIQGPGRRQAECPKGDSAEGNEWDSLQR